MPTMRVFTSLNNQPYFPKSSLPHEGDVEKGDSITSNTLDYEVQDRVCGPRVTEELKGRFDYCVDVAKSVFES